MNDPEYLIKCLIEFIQYESILKKDDDAGDKISAEEFYENKEGNKEEISDGSLYQLPATKEADLVEYQKRIKIIQERIKQREKAFKKLSEAERKKYDLKFLCHFDSTLYFFFPLLFELHQIPFLLNM